MQCQGHTTVQPTASESSVSFCCGIFALSSHKDFGHGNRILPPILIPMTVSTINEWTRHALRVGGNFSWNSRIWCTEWFWNTRQMRRSNCLINWYSCWSRLWLRRCGEVSFCGVTSYYWQLRCCLLFACEESFATHTAHGLTRAVESPGATNP